jgi:hypothetical protein
LRTRQRRENMGAEPILAARQGESGMIMCGDAVALAAQNMGRTGPIAPSQGGAPWASLLAVALLLAGIRAVVALVSTRRGTRQLATGWAVACALSSLAAAYSLWRLVGTG